MMCNKSYQFDFVVLLLQKLFKQSTDLYQLQKGRAGLGAISNESVVFDAMPAQSW